MDQCFLQIRTAFSGPLQFINLLKVLKIFPGPGSEYTKLFSTKTYFGHHVDSFPVRNDFREKRRKFHFADRGSSSEILRESWMRFKSDPL